MNEIILGEGVFAINGIDTGLTRGGGTFVVEREYRNIEADGDKGPVKGRIVLDKSKASLEMNALEMVIANLPKMYPALKVTTATGTDTVAAKPEIEATDYNDEVTWTGKTSTGRSCVITIKNAINLENIDWSLKDKDEIVPKLTFTATYDPLNRENEPWLIEFA